jgi:hypothetical protein
MTRRRGLRLWAVLVVGCAIVPVLLVYALAFVVS